MPVQFDQVAQLTVGFVSGRARVGSGFLLAERLVLTAAHVVDGELAEPIHLSLPHVAASATGSPVWSGSAVGLDAALIELARAPAGPRPTVWRQVRWGRLTGQQPGVPGTAVGFPRVLRDDDGQRVPDQIAGRINPGVAMGQRYDLNVEGVLPLSRGGDPSPWSGLSGAALFSESLLIGVLVIDIPDFQAGRLAAVPVWRLLADQGFAAELRRHGCSTEVESVELSGLFERPPRSSESPASLLRADRAIVGFRGREEELDELRHWCTGGEPLAVALVTGPGGQGKTRLARELGLQMRGQGWLTGFLGNTARATRTAERLADSQLPVLLAVDYAETRLEQLRRLVEAAEEPSSRVRLLLLARSARDWWDRLCRDLQAAPSPAIIALPILEDSVTGRAEAYRQALHDFAGHLAGIDSGTSPQTNIAKGLALADSEPPAATVLQVHTSALIALLQAGPQAVSAQPGEGVEDILLKHEQQYWGETARARHLDFQPETLRNAVAAASLTGATQAREALATLTRVPGLRDQAEDRLLGVASWLHDLYPPTEGQYWGSLQPDRVAEHLVGRIARLDPDFIVQLLAAASDAQKHQAFNVLDRAASHQPHLVDVWPPVERITRVYGDNPAYDAAVRQELLRPGSTLLVLGVPGTSAASPAHLLHCTVPFVNTTIEMLPAFTRMEHVVSAVLMNPAWQSLRVLELDAPVVLKDLGDDEWLGINPWSGREFKLPAASLSSDRGRNGEDEARPHVPLHVDPDNTASYPSLSDALQDLRRFIIISTGLGEASTLQDRYQEAVAALWETGRADPDNATAHTGLGEASSLQDRNQEAVAAWREALRADPDNAVAHTGLGTGLTWLGRYEEAVAAYREALRVDPGNAAAHTGLGTALTWLDRDGEAVAAYREALRVDPGNAATHNDLGHALTRLGRYEEAVAAYREALRVDPGNAAAHNDIGYALVSLGRFEQAAAAWREALRVDPNNVIAHNDLGWLELHVRGDLRAAEQLLSEAVRLDPTFATAASANLASALVAQGNQTAAGELLARAIAHQHPAQAKILLWQWVLARADGSPDTTALPQVLAALDQASPPTGRDRFADAETRAVALLGLGDDSAAETLRSAASMRTPSNMFFRPMYDLLATPEPPQRLDQLLGVWREIIAFDSAAAGALGGPHAQ